MSQNRPLMNVNEESEILMKLGILTSKARSKKRLEDTDDKGDVSTVLSNSITDDEDSELDVLYDKRSLLNTDSRSKNGKRKLRLSAKKIIPAFSFIILGLLHTTIFITLPEISAATKVVSSISSLFIVVINGLGWIVGNFLIKRVLSWCNALFLLLFCTICAVPVILGIAWCIKLYSIYFYSFTLGVFLGFLHQGGLIIVRGNGSQIRTLLLLHICIAFGSMLAPLVCMLFVTTSIPPQTTPHSTNEITIPASHQMHKVVKRLISLPQNPTFALSAVTNASAKSVTNISLNTSGFYSRVFTSEMMKRFTIFPPQNFATIPADTKSKSNADLSIPSNSKLSYDGKNALRDDSLWHKFTKQIIGLEGIKLAYSFVGLLSFLSIFFFLFSLFCCCDQVPAVTSENSEGSFTDLSSDNETALWQWLARLLFVILSGIEIIFNVVITVSAVDFFDGLQTQKKAYFVILAFWVGGVISRLIFCSNLKMAVSIQLMQFLLLITSVISCFIAVFSKSSMTNAITLGIEVFLVGSFLSPVVPCLLGWLEIQNAKSWSILCFDHSAATAFGRAIIPFLAFLLMLKLPSITCLFAFISVLVGCAFLILLLLTRSVRDVARVIAVEKLSETLMASGDSSHNDSKKSRLLERVRDDGYVKLTNKDDSDLEIITSDQEFEDEL